MLLPICFSYLLTLSIFSSASAFDVRASLVVSGLSVAPAGLNALLEIAACMESDGGMPGKDGDARASATIAALLALAFMVHTATSGAFRSHVARLISFLESVSGLHAGRLELIGHRA